MPTNTELIAHGRSEQQVADTIGADRLIYQDLDDLVVSVTEGNPNLQDFECSIFNGIYVDNAIGNSPRKLIVAHE